MSLIRVCMRSTLLAIFVLILIAAGVGEASDETNQNGSKEHGTKYKHVWPRMEFGWKIMVGTLVGFMGAAFGSVSGVGGGGFFIPMLSLIVGFDLKSSTALSKCMIMGGAFATVYYNLKKRHPTKNLPIIDYDLALLMGPMLILGISIGVELNVLLADWMITILLILILFATSTKSLIMGIAKWKEETLQKKEANIQLDSTDLKNGEHSPNHVHVEIIKSNSEKVSILENMRLKEFGLIVMVWLTTVAIQILKRHITACSWKQWMLDSLQIPVCVAVSGYQAVSLYNGRSVIASNGNDQSTNRPKVYQLLVLCFCGILGGVLGGLIGLGGGFLMGPIFLHIGIPPQVSSATSTYVMLFSSSISVVEYYLLKRFPLPYALYLISVATIAAVTGQHVVRKVINLLGRASVIIFILVFTVFTSAIFLGGVGLSKMIESIHHKEYMGFDDLCST